MTGPAAAGPAGNAPLWESAKLLGQADAGPAGGIWLTTPGARHHLHVIGATGVGKSTLLVRLIRQDVAAGRAVIVLDPKGDLITDLLPRLPGRRADGSPLGPVVLIDPAHPELVPTLNPLAGSDIELAVDQLVGIFRRLFEAYWGPRTDDVLRAACLTLGRRGQASLADVPALLTNPPPAGQLLAGVADDGGVLAGFWAWYTALSEGERGRVTGPVLNKLRVFLLRTFARNMISSPTGTLNMPALLDTGGLLLARLPKGLLGEETSRLLGSLLLASTWQAATRRAGQPVRRDAVIYLDECHNFLTLPAGVEDMLAEARGYHLSFTLAHQHLGQLPPATRDAISANARNKIFFAISPEDATRLARHLEPHLTAADLVRLAAYQAAGRLVHHGADTPAFTLRTRPMPPVIPGRADQLLTAAARHAPRPSSRQDALRRRITPPPPLP